MYRSQTKYKVNDLRVKIPTKQQILITTMVIKITVFSFSDSAC